MNERIKELIEQATLPPHRSQGYGGEPTHIYPGTLDPAKFAELIVKECASLFDQNETEVKIPEHRIHNSIMVHFGLY